MINLDRYEPYQASEFGATRQLPRSDALERYEKIIAQKSKRIAGLKRLLEDSGIRAGTSDSDVQLINDWFVANVEEDEQSPGRMDPIWYSVCKDLALYLGDLIIDKNSALHWDLYRWGKTDLSYQRMVIMGFPPIAAHESFDVDRQVVSYGHRIVRSRFSSTNGSEALSEIQGLPVAPLASRTEFVDWIARQSHRAQGIGESAI